MPKVIRSKVPTEKEIRQQLMEILDTLETRSAMKYIDWPSRSFASMGLSDLEVTEVVMRIQDVYTIHLPNTLVADQRFSPQVIIEYIFLASI